MDLYDLAIATMDGKTTTLEKYKQQVLLIVNVASRCGFTSQYEELEKLQQTHQQQGFSILAFPCDQFLHQEPGTDQQIKQFAESCFHITFPLFAKLEVKGGQQAPLYRYLQKHLSVRPRFFIPWNFTKILVDRNGKVLKQFGPLTSFKTLRREIESCL